MDMKHVSVMAAAVVGFFWLQPAAADQKHVVENPDYTYSEILACLSKKAAFKMAPDDFKGAVAQCSESAKGLTRGNFLAILMGCSFLREKEVTPSDSLKNLCDSIEQKLRPYFAANGPALQMLSMSLNDLGVIQLACNEMPESSVEDRAQCLSGLGKLRHLLQNPLPPVSIDPPTPQDYLTAIKADPQFVSSPYDLPFHETCLWLMDPMGHVVRGNDGKPKTMPISKEPDPAHPCL